MFQLEKEENIYVDVYKFAEQEYLKKAKKVNLTHFEVNGLEPGTFFNVKVMREDSVQVVGMVSELKVQTMLEPIKHLAAETKL